MQFAAEHYLWIKALHLIAVISWMAGMLYLPRLFVYHADVPAGSARDGMLQTMERRLLRYIMTPALLVVVLSGGLMLSLPGLLEAGWIHAKLTLVLGLLGVHGLLARHRRQFAAGSNTRAARYYRILNEIPTLLLIGIVILAVVKPF